MYLVQNHAQDTIGPEDAPNCAPNYYKIAKNYRRHLESCERLVPGLQPAGTGWVMLVELYIALHEKQRISVSGVSIMAGVPSTTGLRYLDALALKGAVVRLPDNNDRRRSWVRLTEAGKNTVEQMLAGLVTAINTATDA
ncbi:hypothetical protein [Novosphingobium sp.]|uniref:hypothetical protein n=1 Tax=Novosphingobium sp. TaxID=1874826 RepID=UPI0026328ED3|nr:hypothetical protein [Novosphingobium sp.]